MKYKAGIKLISKMLLLLVALIQVSCTERLDDSDPHKAGTYSLKLIVENGLDLEVRSASEESALHDACFMVFDENNRLESMKSFDACPSAIVFESLSAGAKKLYAVANVSSSFDYSSVSTIEDLEKWSFDSNSPLFAPPMQLIPMTHLSEFTIPLSNPDVTIDMTRQIARLSMVDDIATEGFVTDSVCLSNLTVNSKVWSNTVASNPEAQTTIRLGEDVLSKQLYILPTQSKQISYIVFGKTNKGVTKRYDGIIELAIGKNNSYSLSLKTGQLTEDGIPSDIRIVIDPKAGRYSAVDSTLYLNIDEGEFKVIANSYDSVKIRTIHNWIFPNAKTKAIKVDREFELSFSPNISSDEERQNSIVIYNSFDDSKSRTIKVKQSGENRGPKYYVVVVAGQSNAAGVDRSSYSPQYDEADPRVFELGQIGISPPYYGKFRADSSTLNVVPLHFSAQVLDEVIKNYHHKSMHLSLGKQLLPYIPKDYNVLVVAAAYSGAGFEMPEGIGNYDSKMMRPANFPNGLPLRYRMEAGNGVMFNSLVDRTLYALRLNKRNKFVGVVWSQGEVESNISSSNPKMAYVKFESFAEAYFDKVNDGNVSEQLPRGFAGKHLWYPIDCVPIRKDWHRAVNDWQYATGHVFGGYKVWNPDTYVRIPTSVKMNTPESNDDGHFGQNAFPETIVPLIIKRMKSNGIIGNGTLSSGSLYHRSFSAVSTRALSDSKSYADIQNGLIVSLPFDDEHDITKDESAQKVSITNNEMSITDAIGLTYINGSNRARKVLQLRKSAGGYMTISIPAPLAINSWSMSFMLKREKAKDNYADGYLIRVPGANKGLFFHQYSIESEGGYIGLAFQPSKNAFDRFFSVVTRLNDASFVESHEEWIHYAVSYDHISRECRIYLNGELTMNKTLPVSSDAQTINTLRINEELSGVDGQLFDLYIWNREVSEQTLYNTFIMSYYGISK